MAPAPRSDDRPASCRRGRDRDAIWSSSKGLLTEGGGPHAACARAGIEWLLLACAVRRRRFPVGASPTRRPLQPEAIGAVMEVTKWLKPSISVSRIGDSASVQAATRVNAEQALYEEGKVKKVVSGHSLIPDC
jgi:hypothetical protein